MRVSVDYILKGKTGRLSFRRAYPAELRPFIEGQPRELKIALGSADITSPTVMQAYNASLMRWERTVALAQKARDGAFDELDEDAVRFLADGWKRHCLEEDCEDRWDKSDFPRVNSPEAKREILLRRKNKALEGIHLVKAEIKDALGLGDAVSLVDLMGFEAQDFAEANGYRVSPADPMFFSLCMAMAHAQLSALDAQERRWDGEEIETPLEPVRPTKIGQNRPETFQEIARKLMASPLFEAGEATKQAARTALRYFREVHGPEIAPSEITRLKVTEWLTLMAQKPTAIPAKEKRLPLPKLIELYAERDDLERMSKKTQTVNVTALAALWNKARRQGLIPYEGHNPFEGHRIGTDSRKPKTLTLEEVNAIFALPYFTQRERPEQGRGEAVYWLPLILLFTGARPGLVPVLRRSPISLCHLGFECERADAAQI